MRLTLSNPLRIHYGPKGTTRIDGGPISFDVTRTSPDGNEIIARATTSRKRADEIFLDLAGLYQEPRQ